MISFESQSLLSLIVPATIEVPLSPLLGVGRNTASFLPSSKMPQHHVLIKGTHPRSPECETRRCSASTYSVQEAPQHRLPQWLLSHNPLRLF
jgi:hypothetical protein